MQRILTAQGFYYLVTGLWPLLHSGSFQAITGPKTDLWLVMMVGALTAIIGAVVLMGARRSPPPEIAVLAFGAAGAYLGIDIIYGVFGPLPWAYSADAALQALIFLLLAAAVLRRF